MPRPLPALGRLSRMLLLTGAAMIALGAMASTAAAQLGVYVGYADTLRANPTHFPTPWAPVVKVYGNNCLTTKKACDDGAIRLVNNDKSAVTVKSVVVKLSTCTYNSWPHNFKIGAGKEAILGDEGRKGMTGCSKKIAGFDTSEVGPHGSYWNATCHQSGVVPKVIVTTAAGAKTLRDTGKVLNTGGIDKGKCPKGTKHNESSPWTLIGRQRCPTTVLSLAPLKQRRRVRTAATVTATLRNSGGAHCGRPLQGAIVKFKALSGPNRGKSGKAVTNKQGKAKFTYSSRKTGSDRLRASTRNPTGTIRSNKVKVVWLKGHRPRRAGAFSCEGIGATLLTSNFAVANPKNAPCKAAKANLLSIGPVQKSSARGISAATSFKAGASPKAGDTASARAKVVHSLIGAITGYSVITGTVTSKATEKCVSKSGRLALKRSASSNVPYVTINGKKQKIGTKPTKEKLGPLATLYLNRTIRKGKSLTQRAVEIDLAGHVIAVEAQSEVDYTGRPCSSK